MSQVQILAAPAKFKKLMKYQFWFPWPLTSRECLLEFSAYPVAEKQGMLIIMRTPYDKYLNFELPPENLETVRMSIPIGCLFVQYISKDITKVSILVQANASLISYTLLPEWLLNFGKKQIMYFVMDSLRQTVLAFEGSEYENRVRDKADFYSFLQTVLIRDAAID